MDTILQDQVKKWVKRAEDAHTKDYDPYAAYFSYFIALLIIAKDHNNNVSIQDRYLGDSDEKLIGRLFQASPKRIVKAISKPELVSVTGALAIRLENLHRGSDQSIIYIPPYMAWNSNDMSDQHEQRLRQIKKQREDAIQKMKVLANYWSDALARVDERTISSCLLTFLWQVRNNLFHGEKGYGEADRVDEDAKLLDKSCRLIGSVVSEFLPGG